MNAKKKTKTRADLQREVIELTAQLASACHFASAGLDKCTTAHLMGGGALLQLHALGGRELVAPIVIRDGLSADTIAALQRDIARSYDLAVMFKPKGEKSHV